MFQRRWSHARCPSPTSPSDPLRGSPSKSKRTHRDGRARCLGLCTVLIPEVRLRIIDVTVFQSHGKRWCGLPGRPNIDKDGQARRDDRGKVAYSPVIQFIDRDVGDAFSDRVIEALLEAYPRAFDYTGAR